MQRAIQHSAAGGWPADAAGDAVTLDYDARFRRRMVLHCDSGREVLLDLPKAVAMADGDGLRLEDGGWLTVKARPEPLVAIRAVAAHALARLAWHLGKRHLATAIAEESKDMRRKIEDMKTLCTLKERKDEMQQQIAQQEIRIAQLKRQVGVKG